MQLVGFFAIWASLVALFLSIFALANNSWSEEIDKITFGKRYVGVLIYAITIVASSVNLWESWQNNGGNPNM